MRKLIKFIMVIISCLYGENIFLSSSLTIVFDEIFQVNLIYFVVSIKEKIDINHIGFAFM
jgi:hypothetical protein